MVEPASTGDFAALSGTTGTSKDLDVTTQPVGTTFLLPDFMTFTAMPDLRFNLTFIEPGIYSSADCFAPPATGQNCTPPFPPPTSPFNLTNTATGSTASFAVRGTVTSGGEAAGDFVGVYTTQFVGQTYQDVLAQLQNGGSVEASYSANFTVTQIPEPSTIFLTISGLLLVAGPSLRKMLSR